MVMTDRQWREWKKIRWDAKESRRIQQLVGDDKFQVGWHREKKVWCLGRLAPCTVMVQFGVRTIPTKEMIPQPISWEWRDDGIKTKEHPAGVPLPIHDPRLIDYIRRCDLHRWGSTDQYLAQWRHSEWLEEQKQASEDDDLKYQAKTIIYDRVKDHNEKIFGYVSRSPVQRKWHVPNSMKPWWEKTHDRAAVGAA